MIAVAFIGYVVAGLRGAFAAAAAIFAPVYFMVIVFAPLFRRHAQNEHLKAFVAGVTAAAAGALAGRAVQLLPF